MSAAPRGAWPSPGPSGGRQRGRAVAAVPARPPAPIPTRQVLVGRRVATGPALCPGAQQARCPSGLRCRKRGLFGEVELGDHTLPKLAVFLLPLG